jgi:5-methyltetrahydrofolate--homocysteine methyltransferase
MNELLFSLSECVEYGKINSDTKYPKHLIGKKGTIELTEEALKCGFSPEIILADALIPGMKRIGEKFAQGKAFIPNLLIASKAMNAASEILKPHFQKGIDYHKGKVIMGTVKGDLHDIGKNIVKMVLEGNGWKVIDLGVDTPKQKFIDSLSENKDSHVGLSALLTTTMLNMEEIVRSIKEFSSSTKVFVGGAPLSSEFARKIGADGYFHDPYSFVNHLDSIIN